MGAPPVAAPPAHPPGGAPGLGGLFLGFLSIGAIGFGGVLPWARRMVVDRRRWLTAGEFADLLGLCQFLPGPNIINLAVVLGSRFHGAAGALAAVGGLLSLPVVVVLALAALHAGLAEHPVAGRAVAGLASAASALVLATALKIAAPVARRTGWRRGVGLGIAGAAVVAMAGLRLPLLPSLLVLVPASLILHRLTR